MVTAAADDGGTVDGARQASVGSLAEAAAPLVEGVRSGVVDFLAEASWTRSLAAFFGSAGPLGGAWTRARSLHALDHAIAEIDGLLSRQLDAILHHPRFQRLEASWRSLHRLVWLADSFEGTKIRLIHLTWMELCRDLDRAIEFDQSQTFQKIYSEEFGTPGGEPYGVLIGDYEVMHRRTPTHASDDVAALKGMSQVAAAAFTPFIVAAAPGLLGVDSLRELALPIDLSSAFRGPEYARWRSLRELDDARFLGVALPRVLVRQPYRDDGTHFDGFRYCETVDDETGAGYLWGSAAYAFGEVVMRGYGGSGWFTEIRGAHRDQSMVGDQLRPHGGMVTQLPFTSFETDRPGLAGKFSTELALTERQEKELSDLGFIPLLTAKDTEFSVFHSNQSLQSAQVYDSTSATTNARISAMLQYILCVSRFAHYVKVIARDRVGSFATPSQCQDHLTRWLHNYCNTRQNPSSETIARYPLREAKVQVTEPPGRPGTYQCVIHLRPHSQADQVISEFRLVTELASPIT